MAIAIPEAPVYLLSREIEADFRREPQPLAADIDQRIADALGIPLAPFTTSIEAAFALKDMIFEGVEYVNVDFREYCHKGVMSFLCDLKTGYGESSGQANTRPCALVAALLSEMQYRFDTKDE